MERPPSVFPRISLASSVSNLVGRRGLRLRVPVEESVVLSSMKLGASSLP